TADRRLTGRIHLVARLNDVAHHDAADRGGVEACAPQRLAYHRGAEVGCRNRLERTVEGADRGPDRTAEDDVTCAHGISPLSSTPHRVATARTAGRTRRHRRPPSR